MPLRVVKVALPGSFRAVQLVRARVFLAFSGRAQKLLQHAFCAAGQTPFSALSKGTIFRQAGSLRSFPTRDLVLWTWDLFCGKDSFVQYQQNSTLLMRRVAVSSGPDTRFYFLCHARGPSRPLDSSFAERTNSPVSPINAKDQIQETEVAVEGISG